MISTALSIAINTANKSDCWDFKHGAVCIYKGRIISKGSNVTYTPHVFKGDKGKVG